MASIEITYWNSHLTPEQEVTVYKPAGREPDITTLTKVFFHYGTVCQKSMYVLHQ